MIGVIWCGYRCREFIPASLAGWIAARQKHGLLICAVSMPFGDFPNGPEDGTKACLIDELAAGHLDNLLLGETPVKETEARGAALRWLIEQGCDMLIQADSDELWELDQIDGTIAFMAARPGIAWARGSLRNYVFDRQTYLVDPFTPPRIHRVHIAGGYKASAFWDDNNVLYHRPWEVNERREVRDIELPHVTIPKSLSVRHITWMNDGPNGRSHSKIRYQEARGWNPTFAWDDSRGGLIWRDGQPVSETATDSV